MTIKKLTDALFAAAAQMEASAAVLELRAAGVHNVHAIAAQAISEQARALRWQATQAKTAAMDAIKPPGA